MRSMRRSRKKFASKRPGPRYVPVGVLLVTSALTSQREVRDAVRSRQELRRLGGDDAAVGPDVGAHVGVEPRPQAEDRAVPPRGDRELALDLARVVRRQRGARGGPRSTSPGGPPASRRTGSGSPRDRTRRARRSCRRRRARRARRPPAASPSIRASAAPVEERHLGRAPHGHPRRAPHPTPPRARASRAASPRGGGSGTSPCACTRPPANAASGLAARRPCSARRRSCRRSRGARSRRSWPGGRRPPGREARTPTVTSSAASSAAPRSSAITTATGSPTYRTRSRASGSCR